MSGGDVPGWIPGGGVDPLEPIQPQPTSRWPDAPPPDAPPSGGEQPPDAPPPGGEQPPDATVPASRPVPTPEPLSPPGAPPVGWTDPGGSTAPGPGAVPGWDRGAGGRSSGRGCLVLTVVLVVFVLIVPTAGLLMLGSQVSKMLSQIGTDFGSNLPVESLGPGSSAGPTPSGRIISVEAVRVGDCFDEVVSSDQTVGDLRVIACTDPHDYEMLQLISHPAAPGATFPGTDALESWVGDACDAVFTAYVGIAPVDSAFASTWLEPTEEGWSAGDRSVYCLAASASGDKVDQSVRNAAR